MGIETGALLTALGTAATTAAVGAVATKLLTPKTPDAASQVKPVTAADKPQAAQDVDLNAIQKKNALAASAAGSLSGNNSTLLSGSQGVSSQSLNLGQNSLLGS